jgi:hypothetical protein
MQLDQVRIRIRPRTHLEALDLALWILRRHWMGLTIAAAVGVAPWLALNLYLFAPDPHPMSSASDVAPWEAGYGYVLLLLFEIPWATGLVTLFLGKAMFQQSVSARRIARDWLGSLGQMILFQGIARAACIVFVVTIPILGFSMKYLNEIILLERSSGGRTSKRVQAFHKGLFSRTVGETLADLLLALSMILLLALAIGYLSDLWLGSDASLLNSFLDGGAWLTTWQAQLAAWAVIVYFSIARFVSYLDCRIRREGWDVELLMRAQATSMRRREAA